jgi:hypothetical protein
LLSAVVLVLFDINILFVQDHIWNVRFDYVYCEGIDDLIFEIWERVTEQKVKHHSPVTHPRESSFLLYSCIETLFLQIRP